MLSLARLGLAIWIATTHAFEFMGPMLCAFHGLALIFTLSVCNPGEVRVNNEVLSKKEGKRCVRRGYIWT